MVRSPSGKMASSVSNRRLGDTASHVGSHTLLVRHHAAAHVTRVGVATMAAGAMECMPQSLNCISGVCLGLSPGLSLPLCSKGALIHLHPTLLRRPASQQRPRPPLFCHICSGSGA